MQISSAILTPTTGYYRPRHWPLAAHTNTNLKAHPCECSDAQFVLTLATCPASALTSQLRDLLKVGFLFLIAHAQTNHTFAACNRASLRESASLPSLRGANTCTDNMGEIIHAYEVRGVPAGTACFDHIVHEVQTQAHLTAPPQANSVPLQ